MKTIQNALKSTFSGNANSRELLISFLVAATIATIIIFVLATTGAIHVKLVN